MRGVGWLPVAFGVMLVLLAGAVDRSLARLMRVEESAAQESVGVDQRRAALQVAAALNQAQAALASGESVQGMQWWSVQRPPAPAAGRAAFTAEEGSTVALRLSSRGVTPNGLPEAVVAALALGDEAARRSVGEELALGRLPVRAEDVATLGARLGMAGDPRMAVLEARIRSLPATMTAPRAEGWTWSLAPSGGETFAEIEGWGVLGGRIVHARASGAALARLAALDERTRVIAAGDARAAGARSLDVVPGAALVVAPDASAARRILGWRVVTWAVATIAFIVSLVQARLVRREAALASRERAFVANVTHELRTPLASLRALGETLAAGRGDPEDYGAHIAEETRRLEALVERVLAAARSGEKPALRDCAPGEVARGAVDAVRLRAERREVQLVEEIAADLPAARWDEAAVQGAIANLLENAIKHGRARGRVELRVRAQGERVAIRVSDDGPGIARRDRERIFGRFERGQTDAPGAGLGLSLVEHVALSHGGSVDVESRPGEGSTFTLLLPLRAAS